jgi:hypothetical protein
MTLVKLLNTLSPWLTAFIIIAVAEIYSVGLMLTSRAIWGNDRLSLNNEVAGFKFAVVGVLYAVLLAFIVIAVWEQYRDTETAVRNEAKALVNLQQLSHALPEPAATSIRQHLNDYIADVRQTEWQTMGDGKPSPSAEAHLQRLSQAIFEGSPNELKDVAKFHHALDLLGTINDNRNERLDGADGSVPGMLWLVLIGGGLITLGYPSFFGTSNVRAQTLMTASLAALVALTLFVCLVLDFPFTGQVAISASPFEQALAQMPPDWPAKP